MSETPHLILASTSPRRRDLLRQAGYRFVVRPPPVGERGVRPHGPPGAYVESLAYLKAEAAIEAHGLRDGLVLQPDERVPRGGPPGPPHAKPPCQGRAAGRETRRAEPRGDRLVLGADTAVELGGALLGKPADPDEARRILTRLSGTRHRVLTGLALVDPARGRRLLAHEVTRVRMARMSPEAIDAYVATGEALGKAGAYAVQETGDRYVEAMDGSRTNVVGLPMELLERMLKAAGYEPSQFCDA